MFRVSVQKATRPARCHPGCSRRWLCVTPEAATRVEKPAQQFSIHCAKWLFALFPRCLRGATADRSFTLRRGLRGQTRRSQEGVWQQLREPRFGEVAAGSWAGAMLRCHGPGCLLSCCSAASVGLRTVARASPGSSLDMQGGGAHLRSPGTEPAF